MKKILVLGLATAIGAVTAVQGATISWSGADITGASDVSNNGLLVEALNLVGNEASPSPATVNGVIFQPTTSWNGTNVSSTVDWLTGTDMYDSGTVPAVSELLKAGAWKGVAQHDDQVTLQGLTIGEDYEIQLFLADTRGGVAGRKYHVDGVTGVFASPSGAVITGTFTADAETQIFTAYATAADGTTDIGGHVNAYQLRHIVPNDGIPPAAPANVSASASEAMIVVDWNDNTETDFAYYTVLRSDNAVSNFVEIASGLTESVYTNLPLPAATTYYYMVQAIDGFANVSPNSAVASATTPADSTPPLQPSNLSATIAPEQVNLDWDDNTEIDVSSYSVYRSNTQGGGHALIASNLVTSAFSDTSVTNDITYYYVVTAVDATGNESGNSLEVAATPTDNIPAVPVLIAAVGGNGEVSLFWGADSEPENDLASYGIYRSLDQNTGYALVTNVTEKSYTDTDVINNTTYYYAITAVDAIQESPFSTKLPATPKNKTIILAESLLDDPTFANGTPDASLPGGGTFVKSQFRFEQAKVQFQTSSDTSAAGQESSFTAPINILDDDVVITNGNYSLADAKLEAIIPDFDSSDLSHAGEAQLFGGDQEINGWYQITITNGATIYTGTSGTANLFLGDGSYAEMHNHVDEKWNQLTWDINPFASGGISYADIDGIGIKFFHQTVTPNTVDTAAWFVIQNASINYYSSLPGTVPYETWAGGYSLVEGPDGDDDGDHISNIKEYGLGSNPTNGAPSGNIPTMQFLEDGGTEYIEYVHVVRSDDLTLNYSLALTENLVVGQWTTNTGYTVTGTNIIQGATFNEVTNRIPVDVNAKFIDLIVE